MNDLLLIVKIGVILLLFLSFSRSLLGGHEVEQSTLEQDNDDYQPNNSLLLMAPTNVVDDDDDDDYGDKILAFLLVFCVEERCFLCFPQEQIAQASMVVGFRKPTRRVLAFCMENLQKSRSPVFDGVF